MSRKIVFVVAGSLLVCLIVAAVKAQDPFRRAGSVAVTGENAAGAKKPSTLAERVLAARRSAPLEEINVEPAGLKDDGSSRRTVRTADSRAKTSTNPAPVAKPAADPQEPSTFIPEAAPEALETTEPGDARSAETPMGSLPPIVKRTTGGKPAGGEFMSPGTRSPSSALSTPSPTVTPSHAVPVARRAARPPQVAASRSAATPRGEQSEATVILAGHSPALRVETLGPPSIKLGKAAEYVVQVTNAGETEASDVVVTIDLPESVQATGNRASAGTARRHSVAGAPAQLVWEIERLAGHGHEQLTLKLAPQESRPFELAVDWTCSHARTAARIEVQEPQLAMTLAGPKEMQFGETAVYTITLSNPGTGDAENVSVALLPSPGSVRTKETNRIGAIPAGQQKQIEIELTAREAGEMEVRVGAEADGGLNAEAVASVLVRRANLELTLQGPQLKYAGSFGVYQAHLANTGNTVAEQVTVAFQLPAGAKYLGGSEGAKAGAGTVTWNVGKLAAGAERVLDIKCELTTAGENRFEIKAQGAGELAASAGCATQVEALADLKLTVVEPKGPRPVGEDTVYEIHIANHGTKGARQVNVVAQFSEGIEPTAVEGAKADLVPGQVLFHPLPRIDAGEEVVLRITARAEKEGNHVFRTEVKCSDPETRLANEGTTRYFGSDLPSRTAAVGEASPVKKAGRPIPKKR